jgi:hypothetical protein
MTFSEIQHKRSKIFTGSKVIEEVSSFKYFGCEITYLGNRDMDGKLT